uniref:Uncharacterized protein n=1 Tax=Siphoviridae sp. ctOIB27 TaxID=2826308 RepID=A0A8S5LTL0_9CAUD|nr:MAG TPA: hypothetical protein [Siphoviridae sp. ctOIB27]DAI96217.1 MAG TPA: hypothetical protein [Bacteriophage sp.]
MGPIKRNIISEYQSHKRYTNGLLSEENNTNSLFIMPS